MSKDLKIATILPYKENYTFNKAQAAAIWVCDFYKFSKFKNQNYIFGNTKGKDYLTKNYININISNLKSKFSSSTNEYCKNFIKKTQNINFDIIEIHNRPLVFNFLKNEINSKYIMYFHNDPISMNGSKTINERLKLMDEARKNKNYVESDRIRKELNDNGIEIMTKNGKSTIKIKSEKLFKE